ncbi:hypothetical protein Clacol_007348 [Clathrus columnatus]|uniref:non-specific serine/threonine protein kinase n=1 Tax=Clathrus columnatus TaxID=1419009 RepID=A0AAV5AHW2_9AGAM|nr:hypothetical protein Clacol_007348 [Clathrus columnatus]
MTSNPLDQYEALEVIGNGSFGIIRKVRRRDDGMNRRKVFARKELNFERMTERDRKQIVAEVNILKDLCHENIVRYHDRYVDRENGILYIVMEYCGGGDLGSIIKSCARNGRPLPEDTIWSYFLQILLALQHCHSTSDLVSGSNTRQQILHRDLKPENVFLGENQIIKLGDFGLSKALGTASFANTYVGTPYYMSPELMQEKSYDTKSDIWSLGCLIYELCSLKPPFHEAKTHSELSIFVRNGRIPPLPKGYSQALHQIIKSMLNVNPAMRPSAQQLLQHERIDLIHKVRETEKMLVLAKSHKQSLNLKEKELIRRETELKAKEASVEEQLSQVLARKEAEVEVEIARRVTLREAELREAVLRKEQEVRYRMEKREAELLQAIVKREKELQELWEQYEAKLRREIHEREEQIVLAEEYLKQEWQQLQVSQQLSQKSGQETSLNQVSETPVRSLLKGQDFIPTPGSAMRGVVLTDTGEVLVTPAAHQVELKRLVLDSPQVKLNFSCIFDKDADSDDESIDSENPLSSPSRRNKSAFLERKMGSNNVLNWPESEEEQDKENLAPQSSHIPPATRLRKPSIRASTCPVIPAISQALDNSGAKASTIDNINSGPAMKNKEGISVGYSRRSSTVPDLRTKAVTNAMNSARRTSKATMSENSSRPLLERAKQASEGARKALFRS